jgi:hypothetical protein
MSQLTDTQRAALERLARDLERVFGPRLEALTAYSGHHGDDTVHSLAVVNGLTFKDLSACVPLADGWHRQRVAVPLMLSPDELQRTVDIFPLEYAGIMATATPVRGGDPFAGIRVDADDVRRALETHAKSHLIHLREGYLESRGEAASIGRLIAGSAAPFRTLLSNLARLPESGHDLDAPPTTDAALAAAAERRAGIPASLVTDVFAAAINGHTSVVDPSALLARYVDACQRLWEYVDRWRG